MKASKRKPRGQLLGVQAIQENLRERQAKAKENRDARRDRITPVHRHIIELAADFLGLDFTTAEDFVCDNDTSIDLFDEFVKINGRKILLFYYQDGEVLGAEEIGRTIPGVTKGATMTKLFITDGKTEPLTGVCVYFIRLKMDIKLTEKNAGELCYLGVLDATQTKSTLKSIQINLTKVYQPALNTENLGELGKTPQGKMSYKKFLDGYDSFINYLNSAKVSADSVVSLAMSEKVDVSKIKSAKECIIASQNAEIVHELEVLVLSWCKLTQQVILQSEQIRREADDTGPIAELDHWRMLSSKFNAILEQIKGHNCKMIINVLHIAKSKVLTWWKQQDSHITEAANEAKDNMKYLHIMETFCEPLYRYDPVGMADSLPSLINAIRMIHSISRYYNSSERLTSLFVKVTNQMVKACKNHITDNGSAKIWDQPREDVLRKIQECVLLNEKYKTTFYRKKKKVPTATLR